MPGLEQLCASREIIITCGSGGVGKTTTAAALGAYAAARLGGKVLVLTVDPAKRLATALGLEQFGNIETRVPEELLVEAGLEPGGELWVAMLDTKQSWDDLVRANAPDPATRDSILANPLYRNITGRFVQSHDYIAMERLYEIHASGRYDLIIVDTPPSRNAIDFLDAPERMADFVSSNLLRWLITPSRSRLVTAASRPFTTIADRILGAQFLSDITEFFVLFQTMYEGFAERAESVGRTLSDRRTSFVVVTTLEEGPVRDAEFFLAALAERNLHCGAVILNKALPDSCTDPVATAIAGRLSTGSAGLADELAASIGGSIPGLADSAQTERVLRELGRSFADYRVVAIREREQAASLAKLADVLVTSPHLDRDVGDLAGLVALGRSLW
jgi:anion-transporting  ArsA/GET3 family ATPase